MKFVESIENTSFQYFPFLFISCIIYRDIKQSRAKQIMNDEMYLL